MKYTLDELIAFLCDGDAKNDHIRELITVEALEVWACNDCTSERNSGKGAN